MGTVLCAKLRSSCTPYCSSSGLDVHGMSGRVSGLASAVVVVEWRPVASGFATVVLI